MEAAENINIPNPMTVTEKQTLLAIYSLYQNLPLPVKKEIKKLIDESLVEESTQKSTPFSWEGFHQIQVKGKDAYSRTEMYDDSERG